MTKLLGLLGLCISFSPLLAKEVALKFFEKGTGDPLSRVEVKQGENIEYSDASGGIVIQIPDSGDGYLEFYRKGFDRQRLGFDELRADPEYEVYLFPALSGDDTIVVRGEKKTTISRKSVSIEESKKVAPNNDPALVVKLLPGVQTTNAFSSDILVRGSGQYV
jgi:hypothetical protein